MTRGINQIDQEFFVIETMQQRDTAAFHRDPSFLLVFPAVHVPENTRLEIEMPLSY